MLFCIAEESQAWAESRSEIRWKKRMEKGQLIIPSGELGL